MHLQWVNSSVLRHDYKSGKRLYDALLQDGILHDVVLHDLLNRSCDVLLLSLLPFCGGKNHLDLISSIYILSTLYLLFLPAYSPLLVPLFPFTLQGALRSLSPLSFSISFVPHPYPHLSTSLHPSGQAAPHSSTRQERHKAIRRHSSLPREVSRSLPYGQAESCCADKSIRRYSTVRAIDGGLFYDIFSCLHKFNLFVFFILKVSHIT